MSAAYYAKGMEIWKSPVKTENGDGTSSISIGFQCATATEIVGEEGAQAIAEMLTVAGGSQDRIAALEVENATLRAAARAVIDAEEDFISHMHPDWEKDPVAEAVDALRATMDEQP